MEFDKRYRQLNSAQKQSVDLIDGPQMVIAGPGTGKTELLSVRVARILSSTDTLPENILCLTFTDSGATALRERLISIIGKDAYKVAIHTFHSFGTEIINQNREYFYQGALFQPSDELSQYEILRSVFDSLNYKNPLSSTMNGEYTHQQDAKRVISELKRSGLTSDELLAVLEANEATLDAVERIIVPLISGTVSAKTGAALQNVLPKLQDLAKNAETLYEVTPLIRVMSDSLENTLEATSEHPTKPLTAWKKKWFVKNEKGEFVFKSRPQLAKLRALAYVYYEYLGAMEKAGLYDYDDMILQVVHAMEVHDELRFNLQEQFLYIMVDEFQDTNLAQMRILHNLTDNPANEGRPNIMVVGDDDQAIYSFQGADMSNVLRFQELYPAASLIVLTENYRSGKTILDGARSIITQGVDRLENRIDILDKSLHAHQTNDGALEVYQAPHIIDERRWLVESLAAQIKKGSDPSSIAVLVRSHKEIKSLLPYFSHAGIAVNYERRENILDQPPIKALELLAEVVLALARGEHDVANASLPELLAHPAWHHSAKELWELSTTAYRENRLWMEVMVTLPSWLDAHSWLVELSAIALTSPLEEMLDRMIGRYQTADGDEYENPFYTYYFSNEALVDEPALYIDYLQALRTIRTQLREYRTGDGLTLADFLDFITLHRRLGTSLTLAHTADNHAADALQLMTVHKSKGLEFETVYIFNSVDNVWGEKVRRPSRTISYPENLPFAPPGESADERLRLYYVAMTRAKAQLVISFSASDDREKTTLQASFLSGADFDITDVAAKTQAEDLRTNAELAWYEPLVKADKTLEEILASTLESYKLSATHLTAFLDVMNGGPQAFLLHNLLHFPQMKSASASYGSAIHRTLQQAHVHLTATGEKKPLEDILHDFENNLAAERLRPLDQATYHQKGSEELVIYLNASYDQFVRTQKSELSFASQEVFIGDAHLTGMIDVVDLNQEEKTMRVTDYKTGKPSANWTGSTDYEKAKLHRYRQQLLFYKLLIESSRDFHTYVATDGRLSFVEPTKAGEVIGLDMTFEKDELDRFRELVEKVWQRITTLNLPDTSRYDASYKDVLAFEQDILDGTI